jgi:hypothetical protein
MSGRGGEEITSLSLPGIEPRSSSRNELLDFGFQ